MQTRLCDGVRVQSLGFCVSGLATLLHEPVSWNGKEVIWKVARRRKQLYGRSAVLVEARNTRKQLGFRTFGVGCPLQ